MFETLAESPVTRAVGLALERLYRRGAMTYRFLVARRVQ